MMDNVSTNIVVIAAMTRLLTIQMMATTRMPIRVNRMKLTMKRLATKHSHEDDNGYDNSDNGSSDDSSSIDDEPLVVDPTSTQDVDHVSRKEESKH